ncbi:MAG: septum formation initiator family protein [Deltaproteobacteria bacterium]|jgi:CHASE3 domain sensor protein|nr:septum formation initiator family protein [Deltaproteobacteria bacterium]
MGFVKSRAEGAARRAPRAKERLEAGESRFRKRRDPKEARIAEKARLREARLRELQEMRAPERQALRPKPKDALGFLPLTHFVIITGCIVILVLGLFALNYLAQARNELGAEVSRLTKEQQDLKERNGHLKATLERMVALEDLEIIAKESLGLVMPKTGQIVVLE